MANPDKLYECLDCGDQETVKHNDHKMDGRRCGKCGGHNNFIGFIGVDLSSQKDISVTIKDGKVVMQ